MSDKQFESIVKISLIKDLYAQGLITEAEMNLCLALCRNEQSGK